MPRAARSRRATGPPSWVGPGSPRARRPGWGSARRSRGLLQPAVDEPPRDGQGRWHDERAAALDRGGDLVAREPARVVELAVARGDLAARVAGDEAEHQRARER